MSSFAKISIRFAADLKGFSSQMQNAERSMQKFGKQMTKVGKGLTLGVTAPLVALGTIAVNTFANFEQSLAKVAAVSGATSLQMANLRKNAEDLGATTRYTASEVAGLQLNLSKLGFKPDEILKATDGILSLALATGEDLAESSIVAASTIRGFGLEVSETQRVVDVMASSFSSSALDLQKFSVAMATVAPVANVANQSIEDTTGFLSVLINAGIDASTAGTGLRNIFLDIAKSGLTLDEALAKINNSSNKNATSMELFGKRGATVATVLATNIKEAREFTAVYNDSAGSAKRMADIMDNTLEGAFFRLKSAMESASIALGEELAPLIRKFAEYLAEVIAKFKDLSPETKKFIVVLAGIAAVLGPLLVTLGFLMTTVIPGLIAAFGFLSATAIPAVSTAMASLNTIILANPIGAVAAAIGLLVFAFTDLVQHITPAVSKLQTFYNLIKSGGNAASFASLQMIDQAKGMMEASEAAKKGGLSLEEYNKRLKESASLFEKVNGFSLDEIAKVPNAVAPLTPNLTPGEGKRKQISALDPVTALPVIESSPFDIIAEKMPAQVEFMNEQQLQALDNALQFNEGLTSIIQNTAGNFAEGFGQLIASAAAGGDGLDKIGKFILGTLGDMAIQVGKLAIGIGIAIIGIKEALTKLGGVGAIVAGIALIALGTFAKSALSNVASGSGGGKPRAFADGGIVYGPTNALIGEYAGARSNPEVVAPLDKLKSLLQPVDSGGNQPYVVETRLSGQDIIVAMRRANEYKNRRS